MCVNYYMYSCVSHPAFKRLPLYADLNSSTLHMRGHVFAGFFVVTSYSCKENNGFCNIVANFDAFTCIIVISLSSNSNSLNNCNSVTKTVVFTLQE